MKQLNRSAVRGMLTCLKVLHPVPKSFQGVEETGVDSICQVRKEWIYEKDRAGGIREKILNSRKRKRSVKCKKITINRPDKHREKLNQSRPRRGRESWSDDFADA